MHICSVDGCQKQTCAKGLCQAHYRAFRKYGDPLLGKKIPQRGKPREFLEKNIFPGVDTDECILWPFSKDGSGAGIIFFNGRKWGAHRFVCLKMHGPAPTSRHYACHECGNGHLGCVNPNHLYWGTPSENQLDRRKHGTSFNGDGCPHAKLTWANVEYVRRTAGRKDRKLVARELGVSPTTIRNIIDRKTWVRRA